MDDSRTEAGKVHDEPEISCYALRKEVLNEWGGHVKRHRSHLECAPIGQNGDNLNLKQDISRL